MWSSIYDTEQNPLVALEEPVVDALLGPVRGLRVADIGCGTGRHAVRLADAGAHVVALDFSEGMLARAYEKAQGRRNLHLVRHDLNMRLPLTDGIFDRVICCLVLDHITDLRGLFSEMRRVCAPDGAIVTSVVHPALMLRGVTARFTDPRTGLETRPASQPNQISDYVMGAVRAGLRIDQMSEHIVGQELATRVERAAKYLGWPLLLAMRLRP